MVAFVVVGVVVVAGVVVDAEFVVVAVVTVAVVCCCCAAERIADMDKDVDEDEEDDEDDNDGDDDIVLPLWFVADDEYIVETLEFEHSEAHNGSNLCEPMDAAELPSLTANMF